ncbi:hypothetical protein JHK86_006199 [Glycine max]|nr:hypothetical protein JHK86_006199 [Glycine max]
MARRSTSTSLNLYASDMCDVLHITKWKYKPNNVDIARDNGQLIEFQAILGVFFVSDYIPFTGWIDKLKELHARLEGSFKELDNFYQEIIDEHRDQNRQHAEEKDIVDVMLQLKNESSLAFDLTFDHIKGVLMGNSRGTTTIRSTTASSSFAPLLAHEVPENDRSLSIDLTCDHIKGVLMNILAAGTDTTAATSVWAMTALVKNPRVMKKVQEEVRNVGGTKDFLDEDDIQKLPYFKAMIKETLRLHLPSQLLIPRESTEECIVDGYRIPAKTIVYVNAWVIQRDPEVWKNPEEFCPERFLDSAIDYRGQDFELIPFGAGRRICPGIPMAAVILELVLANLLHSFDWKLPQGMVKEDIDVERDVINIDDGETLNLNFTKLVCK